MLKQKKSFKVGLVLSVPIRGGVNQSHWEGNELSISWDWMVTHMRFIGRLVFVWMYFCVKTIPLYSLKIFLDKHINIYIYTHLLDSISMVFCICNLSYLFHSFHWPTAWKSYNQKPKTIDPLPSIYEETALTLPNLFWKDQHLKGEFPGRRAMCHVRPWGCPRLGMLSTKAGFPQSPWADRERLRQHFHTYLGAEQHGGKRIWDEWSRENRVSMSIYHVPLNFHRDIFFGCLDGW